MENPILNVINEIDFSADSPEETRKPRKPVCDLFEKQPDRPPVWCNYCGRHKDLHSSVAEDNEPEEKPAQPINAFDPLKISDRDSYNAIYKGGNSSPFPYDSQF